MRDRESEFPNSEGEPHAQSSPGTLPAKQGARATDPALYLVGTPIGNLEDITLRALRILKEVDVIACEDTRQTQKLLNHYAITTRTTSYHEHNEMTRSAELVKEMQEGASVALVTDAGMPGISDPGYRLIALAIRHRVPVVPIPGRISVPGSPGGQRPAHRFIPLQRIPPRQARRAARSSGGDPEFSPDASFLRSSAPDRRVAARHLRSPGRIPPRSNRPRSHQAARRIPARPRRRSAGELEGARDGERRDHAADWESRKKTMLT